jgi:hypothetical protein
LIAKASTAKVYQPILATFNIIYAVLYVLLGHTVSVKIALVHLLLVGLQLYAYFGILEDAASSKPIKDNTLVGGASLDLLGAVLLLQYLGGLFNHRLYYLLGLLPIWGGCKVYTLLYGQSKSNQPKSADSASPVGETNDDLSTQRRRQRAEKRRQKW